MGTVKGMLDQARACIGMGEPNKIQAWYRDRNGHDFDGNFSWCEASLTYWAFFSGNAKVVDPFGDRAYTVFGAYDAERASRTWYPGSSGNIINLCKPGAKVYFDWGGTDNRGDVDHVGVCEQNLADGRLVTIEGNTSDQCLRRVRSSSVIAGFWNPAYDTAPTPPAPPAPPLWANLHVPSGTPNLLKGSHGRAVHDLQQCINAVIHAKLSTDGIFGVYTRSAVVQFQKRSKFMGKDVDGVYGTKTASAMHTAVSKLK